MVATQKSFFSTIIHNETLITMRTRESKECLSMRQIRMVLYVNFKSIDQIDEAVSLRERVFSTIL